MKKTILFVLVSLSIFHSAQSQKNIVPGYIVSLEGDTISVDVDYRIWSQNPKKVTFFIDGTEVTYNGTEILGFGMEDLFFKGAIVQTNISSRDPYTLESTVKPNIRVDTVFIQGLLTGPKSLYMATNQFGIQNFYLESDGTLTLLEYKKYILDYELNDPNDNGNDRVALNQKYIGQLTVLLGDCPEINKILQSISYTENSLRKVFSKYYQCTGSSVVLNSELNGWKSRIGVIIGFTNTNVNFKNTPSSPRFSRANFEATFGYTFGVHLEFLKPKRRWSLSNDLIYNSFLIKGEGTSVNGIFIRSNNFTYGLDQITANAMGRYLVFETNSSKIFLSSGLSFSYTIGSTNINNYTVNIGSPGTEKAFDAVNKSELGFIGGLGINKNKLTFEARYESSNGAINYARTNRQYFLIGYNF